MNIEEYCKTTKKMIQKDIAILEDYIKNSDDFKMDCTPIPLEKK